MGNPSPRKCMHCRERAVSPTTLPSYVSEMDHDGRKYSVSIPDFEVLQCQRCGEIVLDDSANDRLDNALRATVGLLAPAEIRQQRMALKLSQNELATHLGISVFTLSRWESGAQIQQRCMDKFLRTFFGVLEARRFLGIPDVAPGMFSSQSGPSFPPIPQGVTYGSHGIPWDPVQEVVEAEPVPGTPPSGPRLAA